MTDMKVTFAALLVWLLAAIPPAVQAQFTYTTNEDNTLTVTGYAGSPGAVIIPANINGLLVTIIGDDAFEWNTNLTGVTIPVGVSEIGVDAFAGCYGLTSVEIPSSVTEIGDWAFLGCISLTNIVMSNGVVSIGSGSFAQCTNLLGISIPNTITNIGSAAFQYCYSLQSVMIPASVNSIGSWAFSSCVSLSNAFFAGNAPTSDPPPADGAGSIFIGDPVTIFYFPGAAGWSFFYGYSTVLWNPLIQTNDGHFGINNNQFGFNITGTTNIPVMVDACTNLVSPVWIPLQTLTLTNGSVYFSDSEWTNHPSRFYRLSSSR
jgi:hypothetical protein